MSYRDLDLHQEQLRQERAEFINSNAVAGQKSLADLQSEVELHAIKNTALFNLASRIQLKINQAMHANNNYALADATHLLSELKEELAQ